jgi:hypothetical protein
LSFEIDDAGSLLIKLCRIDPIVVTSLGSETTISASAESIAILKQHKTHQKNQKYEKRGRSSGGTHVPEGHHHKSGPMTPHIRPPPPTPQEHAAFPYTLSTPHLPVFHHYTDDVLLQQYQIERAKDSLAFDQQTAKIKQYLLNAKIERGGVGFLEESEYSVDLASREDARKVQGMTIQRNREMKDTEVTNTEGETFNLGTTPGGILNLSFSQDTAKPTTKNMPILRKHDRRSKPAPKPKPSPSVLPTDFDFANHVAKYITSGSMRHQHSRKVVEDPSGTKTTLKTWIEITQEITVPSAEQLGWEDVETAKLNAKAARMEAKEILRRKGRGKGKGKGKAVKRETQQGSNDTDADADASTDTDKDDNHAAEPEKDVKELLSAIARIKNTGQLSQGVSLSQYLTEVKKDVRHSSVADAKIAESGGEEG